MKSRNPSSGRNNAFSTSRSDDQTAGGPVTTKGGMELEVQVRIDREHDSADGGQNQVGRREVGLGEPQDGRFGEVMRFSSFIGLEGCVRVKLGYGNYHQRVQGILIYSLSIAITSEKPFANLETFFLCTPFS